MTRPYTAPRVTLADGAPAHTPGPWMVLPSVQQTQLCVLTENGVRQDICRTYGFAPANEANARLIAAAPEMLAALKNVAEGWGDHNEVLDAIAKATGK